MGRKKNYRSDFLFATPSFVIGMGTVLSLAGKYFKYNYSATDEEADSNAIESDWGVVGQDIKQLVEENPIEKFGLCVG